MRHGAFVRPWNKTLFYHLASSFLAFAPACHLGEHAEHHEIFQVPTEPTDVCSAEHGGGSQHATSRLQQCCS